MSISGMYIYVMYIYGMSISGMYIYGIYIYLPTPRGWVGFGETLDPPGF